MTIYMWQGIKTFNVYNTGMINIQCIIKYMDRTALNLKIDCCCCWIVTKLSVQRVSLSKIPQYLCWYILFFCSKSEKSGFWISLDHCNQQSFWRNLKKMFEPYLWSFSRVWGGSNPTQCQIEPEVASADSNWPSWIQELRLLWMPQQSLAPVCCCTFW